MSLVPVMLVISVLRGPNLQIQLTMSPVGFVRKATSVLLEHMIQKNVRKELIQILPSTKIQMAASHACLGIIVMLKVLRSHPESAILDSSAQVDRKQNDLQNMFAHLGIVVPLEVSINKLATLVPTKMNTSSQHAKLALKDISVMELFSMLLTVHMVSSSLSLVSQDTTVQMELNLPRSTSVHRVRSKLFVFLHYTSEYH